MVVRPVFGSVTFTSCALWPKCLSPLKVRSGMFSAKVMVRSESQVQKAAWPRLLMVEGMVTSLIRSHSRKAFFPMVSKPSLSVSEGIME